MKTPTLTAPDGRGSKTTMDPQGFGETGRERGAIWPCPTFFSSLLEESAAYLFGVKPTVKVAMMLRPGNRFN